MIKKKREMARKMGVSSVDYMPLDEDRKCVSGLASVCMYVCAYFVIAMNMTQGCHGYRFGSAKGKSRLVRDDDNDRSDEDGDDEEGSSRVLTFGSKTQPAKQMQVGGRGCSSELTSRSS